MKTKQTKDINKLAYCDTCEDFGDFTTEEIMKKYKVRERSFNIVITKCYCKKCGDEAFNNRISLANEKKIYDRYKRLEGLLTSDEIKAIRTKRGLTQVELARLINCGEKNIARYENGAIQDRAFDLLIRLVDFDDSYKVMRDNQKRLSKLETLRV